jgi:hypothetical protein
LGVIPIIVKSQDFTRQGSLKIPIIREIDNFSLASNSINLRNDKVFIRFLTKFLYNGDCSSVVERTVVVRETGVRFSSLAFLRTKETLLNQDELNSLREEV